MSTPPRPTAPAIRMQWSSLAFVQWRVDPAAIQRTLPRGLAVDIFDGSAWIGLVPFTMPVFRPRFWPKRLDMWNVSRFHECNVRTYVRPEPGHETTEPGVWFYSLDATSRVNVWGARTFWHLPYRQADIWLDQKDDVIAYQVQRREPPHRGGRARLTMRWRVGAHQEADDLATFLTERYALYAASPSGRLYCGRVAHESWPLHAAELLDLDDELVATCGVPVDGDQTPLVYAASPIDVDAWLLKRVRRLSGAADPPDGASS